MLGERLLGSIVGSLTRVCIRPYASGRPPSHKVAIVIPLSLREMLPDEEVSLRQLCHFLGKHDKFLLTAHGTSVTREGFTTVHLPRKFFGSGTAIGRLLMWPPFYQRFTDYEYIFVYHLDALVFSSDLESWCEAGWDYIGAPWLPSPDTPWVKAPAVAQQKALDVGCKLET